MTSSNEQQIQRSLYRRPRLDPSKWNRWPLEVQIGSSLALAILVIVLAYLVMPNAADWAKRYLLVSSHEGGHGLVGFLSGGTVHEIILRADGSGTAVVSGHNTVATAAAGPLFPVVLGAIMVAFGVTRLWMPFLLMLVAVPLFWLGYEHHHIIEIQTTLWIWATLAIATAWFCRYHTVRSAVMLIIGGALLIGSYDGLPSLSAEWVANPSATPGLALGPDAPEGQIPSDTRIIADAYNQPDVNEVRSVLISAMAVTLFLMASSIARFVFIYRR